MTVIAGIGFTAPWLLLGLLALPILWLILRAVPPAPIRRRFPGVALLLGLKDDDQITDRTPWWLLALRMLAVGAVIIGLAGPVANPRVAGGDSRAPLLVLVDGTWAGSPGWARLRESALAHIETAGQLQRPVGLLVLTDPKPVVFEAPSAAAEWLAAFVPHPWQPSPDMIATAEDILAAQTEVETLWVSDGLDYPGRDQLLALAEELGPISVLETARARLAMAPASYEDGEVRLPIQRATAGPGLALKVQAEGTDPAGNPAVLASGLAEFGAGETATEAVIDMQAEMRKRITRFTIEGTASAGATTLVDDSLRRREIALIDTQSDREDIQVLSPLHYLEQSLVGKADVLKTTLDYALPANPDVVVLADVAVISGQDQEALLAWIEAGGTLLRFAGPRLAASEVSRREEDPLMPVRLRAGGRTVGGAMSWGEPKSLAPFKERSPFFGLPVPDDVVVKAQVMAQPDPELASRVVAELTDGTPLVTRKSIGLGQVVLFHVTANAEWSDLPLSVLFLDMLERLFGIVDGATVSAFSSTEALWQPVRVLDAAGQLYTPTTLGGVSEVELQDGALGPALPPGVYQAAGRAFARNVMMPGDVISAAVWPASVTLIDATGARERPLGGPVLSFALLLLLADVIAVLALSGRLLMPRTAAPLLAVALLIAPPVDAQDGSDFARDATAEVVLAHILTGDARVDEVARAGLKGLSDALFFRTSVEPADPIGINLETDELAFFPMLYWPMTADQPRPSVEAYARLNEYLRSGGLILFDTRDGDTAGFGTMSPMARRLQTLAAPLDIPQLEPLPKDHVITRTFYLLQDFPGRYTGRDLWVEAAPPDAEAIEGMPFRNLNDGVTPVVIGGNDWAAAWAVNRTGGAMVPVGRGFSGERQRELAYRFGINLVMHVLTGNYKSDQVHVPALLDRLGQ